VSSTRDAWDNKPPLIYFTYAGIQAAFGTGVFPLHLVAMLVVLAAQADIVATAASLYGVRRAIAAGAMFALLIGTPLLEGDVAMTETFMIVPSSLAVLIFVRSELRRDSGGRDGVRGYVAAGALLGVAAGYKQVAVFDAAAIAVMIWLTHREPLPALAALAAGFAAPQAALALLFLATGAFSAYWYAVAGSLPLYARLGPEVSPFVRFASYLPALLVAAVLARRRATGEAVTIASFPALWLGFAVAGVLSSTFAFPHYIQQAVPAIALCAVSSPLRFERDMTGRVALSAAGVLAVAVLYGQFAPAYRERAQVRQLRYYRDFVQHQWGSMSDLTYAYRFDGAVAAKDDIAAAMRQDGGGPKLFSWSELPWLYPEAGVRNPTRYYTSFLGDEIPGARAEILRDVQAHPPDYVLISDSAHAPFEELETWVRANYAQIRAQGDWRLYRVTRR
jgi:hypothetical protein